MPRPIRHVGNARGTTRCWQNAPRHRPRHVPLFDVHDGDDRQTGTTWQAQGLSCCSGCEVEAVSGWPHKSSRETLARRGRDPGPLRSESIPGVITKETALARLPPSELKLDAPVAVDVGGGQDRLEQRLGAAGVEGLDVLEEGAHACGEGADRLLPLALLRDTN